MAFGMRIVESGDSDWIDANEEYLLVLAKRWPVFTHLVDRFYDSPALEPVESAALAGECDRILHSLQRDGAAAWPADAGVRATERNVADAIAAYSRWRAFFCKARDLGSIVACDSD